jgi:hypothetical protein
MFCSLNSFKNIIQQIDYFNFIVCLRLRAASRGECSALGQCFAATVRKSAGSEIRLLILQSRLGGTENALAVTVQTACFARGDKRNDGSTFVLSSFRLWRKSKPPAMRVVIELPFAGIHRVLTRHFKTIVRATFIMPAPARPSARFLSCW